MSYGEGLIGFHPYLSIHKESETSKKAQTFCVNFFGEKLTELGQNRYIFKKTNSFKCLC